MSDDYLWDRSDEPDPEIKRLEEVLGRLRSQRPVPQWPQQSRLRQLPVRGTLPMENRWHGALAAGLALMVGASWLASRPARTVLPEQETWKIAHVEGAPMVGSTAIRGSGRLAVGQSLVTDDRSRAIIDQAFVGEVELDPNSRLRLVRARQTDHRLALDLGTMHATIWAPPRLFSVETPATVAVDLGCAYTLHVDAAGTTTLHATMGWVGFEQNGLESWVPAGAECVTRRGHPPGTPYFADASEAFRRALAKFDAEHDQAALEVVLADARPLDALTLWHLLPRTQGELQVRVYQRFAQLVPPPAGVTRQGVLLGNKQMLSQWWDELGYGDSSMFRLWKGPSPFKAK